MGFILPQIISPVACRHFLVYLVFGFNILMVFFGPCFLLRFPPQLYEDLVSFGRKKGVFMSFPVSVWILRLIVLLFCSY